MKRFFKILLAGTLVLGMTGCAGSGGQEEDGTVEATEYDVISEEVPNFEAPPINYNDSGWIYLEKGTFGFLSRDNTAEVPSGTYTTMFYKPLEKNAGACMYQDAEPYKTSTNNKSIDLMLRTKKSNPCNKGTSGMTLPVVLASNGNVYEEFTGKMKELESSIFVNESDSGSDFEGADMKHYSIVLPDLETVYGPYDSTELASFSAIVNASYTGNNPYKDILGTYYGNNHYNYGIFYNKEGKRYRIYSADGQSKSDYLYTSATPLSDTAMKVERGGLMGVVDSSLKEVYMGKFEDVSEFIGGRGYVKIDGKWKFIQLKDVEFTVKGFPFGQYTANDQLMLRDMAGHNGIFMGYLVPGEVYTIANIVCGEYNSVWGELDEVNSNLWVCMRDYEGNEWLTRYTAPPAEEAPPEEAPAEEYYYY